MRGKVTLAHGAGGIEMEELLEKLIFSRVDERLKKVEGGLGIDFPDDAAAIPVRDGFVVITTDSYTVKPPFFPETNIGGLAASGTINDVLMLGGKPIAMLDSIIIEEGFPEDKLREIVNTMMEILKNQNVALIGGDFKVMPRGSLDGVVINMVGIGYANRIIIDKNLRPGDKIIVSGPLGEHGAVILALQQGFKVESGELKSDARPLTDLMLEVIEKASLGIHAARDPTRGGLAMLLNDWAKSSGTVIVVDESKIPVREVVKSYSEMLGIDPLSLASEGVAVLGVDGNIADEVIEIMTNLGYKSATIIGEVRSSPKYKGLVLLKSVIGGYRILEPPRGELVPRIC